VIEFESVTKRYPDGTVAVNEVSLQAPSGKITVFVGPSGCGKTTSLRMINRMIEPTNGHIRIDGEDTGSKDPATLRRGIGYVIQHAGLFPHRTVLDNVATVPVLLGKTRREAREAAMKLLERVGLAAEFAQRYPAQLSGGQQQRVGVARALAADPPILLMDEPYSAVDPIVRARLQDELLDLQRRVQKTIVLVTHDIDEAIKLADRIVVLNVGGVLAQVGPPEELLRAPADDFVADFMGHDRGIKRLSLITVDDVALREGPVVAATATVDEARAVAARHAVDWVGVRDGDGLRGWAYLDDLGTDTVDDAPTKPFRAAVGGRTTLKAALDVIVTSQTRVAVVLDDEGRYRGMLTIDELAEGLT
jgi:osmoprotectant transport system ATP-binding protein